MSETNTADKLVGKFCIFFEQGCPRNSLYYEEAAYEVTEVVGTKKLSIRPVALPLGHEVKVRTSAINGDHIAAWFSTKANAVQALHLVRALKRQVNNLVANAASEISALFYVQPGSPLPPVDLAGEVPVAALNGIEVAAPTVARTRTRAVH